MKLHKSVTCNLIGIFFFIPLLTMVGQDSLIISEFMAINNNNLQDEDGTYSDWIEIFNGGSADINLNGWFLTDDATNFSKWPFPAMTIEPGEYLVILGHNGSGPHDRLPSGA